MTKRPQNLVGGCIFSFRGRFNSILEERLLNRNAENHFIMSIEVEPNDFDIGGNFTSPGAATFWREVSKAVQKLDAGEITLRLCKFKQEKRPSEQVQHKLPTPPLIKRQKGDESRRPRHEERFKSHHHEASHWNTRKIHRSSHEHRRSHSHNHQRRRSRSHSHNKHY